VRILADENFARATVEALRLRGHDVVWVPEDAPSTGDPEVLARALSEDRVLVTFDKDFGDLAVRQGLAVTCGVVLVRVRQLSTVFVTRLVVAALESRIDWKGHFWVVEETRIRMAPVHPRGGMLG
jgi:predicted nuclease of predicted toxin-antitoxin system